jgi:predicted HicB family RNase H-like nuclease
MTPEYRKRMSIDIPTELHRELRFMALKHNTSLTTLVCQWLILKLKEEKKIDEE